MQENDLIEIVPTKQLYSYNLMKQNINELKRAYPFLEIKTAGYSVLGKSIPYIKIGNGKTEILYHASIHANEWITSVVLMKLAKIFCTRIISKSFTIYYPNGKSRWGRFSNRKCR